jgi:hypothetical protein
MIPLDEAALLGVGERTGRAVLVLENHELSHPTSMAASAVRCQGKVRLPIPVEVSGCDGIELIPPYSRSLM